MHGTSGFAAEPPFWHSYEFQRMRLPLLQVAFGATALAVPWYVLGYDLPLVKMTDGACFVLSIPAYLAAWYGHPVGSMLVLWGLFQMGRVMGSPAEDAYEAAVLPLATAAWIAAQPVAIHWTPPDSAMHQSSFVLMMICVSVGLTVACLMNAIRFGAQSDAPAAAWLGATLSLIQLPVFILALTLWPAA